MFDNNQRVTGLQKQTQGLEEGANIFRMQAGRGLVEHVDHAKQTGDKLRGQSDTLQLTGREHGSPATQREVAEAQPFELVEAAADIGRHPDDGLPQRGFARHMRRMAFGKG